MTTVVVDQQTDDDSDDSLDELDALPATNLDDSLKLKDWVKQQVAIEQARLQSMAMKALPMTVKNITTSNLGHRIEIASAFDFNNVVELLLSDAQDCALKPGFVFQLVVLFTANGIKSNICMLVPIVIPESFRHANSMDVTFVNSNFSESTHHVDLRPLSQPQQPNNNANATTTTTATNTTKPTEPAMK